MRLLQRKDNQEFSLTKDLLSNIPDYAILSHTWGEDDQEVTFKDLVEGSGTFKIGYKKIQFCGEQAARDGLQYIWVDTCCIDKTDAVELQKAINSMFRWYKNAVKCYVYLPDVSIPDDEENNSSLNFEPALRTARWFTRGWTLQELLAPPSVEFFAANYRKIGDRISLEPVIYEITGIPVRALQNYDPTKFSVEERVSWIAKRETRHEEDMAYSLLGIFAIFLPLIYGEGRENAFRRLREEVNRRVESHKFDKVPKFDFKNQIKFTVPFVRDLKFVGREDIIQEITNRLEMKRRVALCGIGGIGKSQIAIEYCYTWKDRHPDSHVFWVHASTFDRFEQAYRDIAKDMSIPGTEDPQNDALMIVRDWLNKPENGPWLLVLDNVDDLNLFFGLNQPTSTKPNHSLIGSFLPRNPNGFMIATTRDKRIGQRLIDREEEITITPLASRDAEQLLRSRITVLENLDDKDTQILVEILGCIPLAITQAAAFIQENSMTVKAYTKELEASDSDLQDYLDENLPDPRRYPGDENSVTRTWKLSFDQIAKHFPQAANLLSLMIQFDRQAIPKALLKHKSNRGLEFNKALGTLQAYSLIRTEKGGSSFEIHRLIQLSTQRWLSLQQKQIEWQEKALELMVEKFPSGGHGTWEECESLFLHAKRVTKYTNIHKPLLLQRAKLLERVATYDESQGRFRAAFLQFKDVLQVRESKLGKKHPDTLTTMSNLARVLDRQGKYTEAEAMNRQTLELKEEILGKKHPDTLTTMSNLAGVLDNQGKYTEAEAMNRQTLELKEEILGKKHPNTLTTMSNLALVLNRQGKYTEAEAMNRQTLELSEEILGKKHPDTLTTMSNLALVLDRQGKYTEAEAMNRQTLELSEEMLGKKHPDTLATMSNLALVLDRQGKYTEAEAMNRQTLELKEEILGKKHPDTLTSVYCLAYFLQHKKEYKEASILYQRACTGYKSLLGSEHPTTIACKSHYLSMLEEENLG
ncbi:hypothetical protein BGZ60DRAFT_456220 [Tricladium varicosporioides]|nr:hypothetical protein BGZ60DRAFT_456220 [Hymenoscyphus varicosporioides]